MSVRTIEVLLLVLTCAGAARVLTPLRGRVPLAVAVAGATTVVLLAHLVLERPRWQLLPVYLVAVATTGLAARDARRPCGATRRRAPVVLGVLLALLGGAVGWALPVTELREPTGPHPVGTATLTLVDEAREDPYRKGERRRLAVQVWYPRSEEAEHEPAAWVDQPEAFSSIAADWLDMPAFTLRHVGLVTTHATRDAPVAAGERRPLVVYAHGWTGFRNVHSTLLESLASHGYIVAAADHAPGALAALHPGGEVVPLDPAALPSGAPQEVYDRASQLLMTTFADDLDSVVARLRGDERFADHVDPGRIAMIGHSTGGGAAILACGRQPGCGAAVGFDPWVEPLGTEQIGEGLEQPLLSIRSEEWAGKPNDTRLRRLHAASHEASVPITIAGATHRDFTLLPMLTPLAARIGLSGPTGGDQTHEIVDEWTVAFLDHHLRDEATESLPSPPEHDEVTVDRGVTDD
jgi:predicted dienelactone hydrolase